MPLIEINDEIREKGVAVPPDDVYQRIISFASNRPYCQSIENGTFRFIDLFAGIGGIRIPFQELGGTCVFSSEWDQFAQKIFCLVASLANRSHQLV